MKTRPICLLSVALIAVLLRAGDACAQAAQSTAAYQIVLRSRHAQAMPATLKRSQTGGGSILIAQPEPNTVVFTMGGAAVAGSGCKPSNAAIHYELIQDLEIVQLRSNARPPRVGMIGRMVGTVQVTEAHLRHSEGSAAQGPATANLLLGGVNVLCMGMEPTTVACGQKLSINHQCGPVETVAQTTTPGTGCYRLTSSFDIGANQGKGVFDRQFAVADFDPAPQLDAFWADGLKPFRAVPRSDFGFTLVLRVVEDSEPTATAANYGTRR